MAYKEYGLPNKLINTIILAWNGIDTIRSNGFYASRDFSTSLDFNTRIYGVKMFQKRVRSQVSAMYCPQPQVFWICADYAAAISVMVTAAYLPTISVTALFTKALCRHPAWAVWQFQVPSTSMVSTIWAKCLGDKDSTGFKNIRLIDNLAHPVLTILPPIRSTDLLSAYALVPYYSILLIFLPVPPSIPIASTTRMAAVLIQPCWKMARA